MISEAMPTFLYTDEDMGVTGSRRKVDDFEKSHSNRRLCKEAKFKALPPEADRSDNPPQAESATPKLDYLRSHHP